MFAGDYILNRQKLIHEMGTKEYKAGQADAALKLYIRATELTSGFQMAQIDVNELASLYHNIAIIYQHKTNYQLALDFAEKGLKAQPKYYKV